MLCCVCCVCRDILVLSGTIGTSIGIGIGRGRGGGRGRGRGRGIGTSIDTWCSERMS